MEEGVRRCGKAGAGSVETHQPFDPATVYAAGAALGLTPSEIRDASLAEILTLWAARRDMLQARAGKASPMTQAELEETMRRFGDDD